MVLCNEAFPGWFRLEGGRIQKTLCGNPIANKGLYTEEYRLVPLNFAYWKIITKSVNELTETDTETETEVFV